LVLIFVLLTAVYLYCTLGSQKRQRNYLVAFVVVIIALAVSGLVSEETRIYGLLGNPIYLGTTAVLGIFLVGFVQFTYVEQIGSSLWRQSGRLLSFAIVLVLLITQYKSGSRGPLLGFIAGVSAAIFSAWLLKAKPSLARGWATALALMVVVSSSLWLANITLQSNEFSYNSLAYRLQKIATGHQTVLDRFANWSVATEVFEERPIIGHGNEAYVREFTEHYQAGVLDNADLWFDRAHNAFLDVLVAHGLVGLILYLSLIGLSSYALIKRSSYTWQQQSLLLGLITCHSVKNLVGFDSPVSSLLWVTFLVLVILGDQPTTKSKTFASHGDKSAGYEKVVCSGLLLAALYFVVIMPYQANTTMLRAAKYTYATRSFDDSIGKMRLIRLNKALTEIDEKFPAASAEHLQAMFETLKGRKSLSKEVLTMYLKKSQELTLLQPNNHRTQYNAALLLNSAGEIKLAIAAFENLVKQAPNRTIFWIWLVHLYHKNGDFDKAQAVLKKVEKLNLKYFARHFS
jgi:O-antigen ligase